MNSVALCRMAAAIVGCLLIVSAIVADDVKIPAKPDAKQKEMEKKFISVLDRAEMVGFFTIDGRGDGKSPPKDKYTIESVQKVKGNRWIITARMQYFNVDLKVPVPVEVEWAGDTPMIILTDVSLPGMTGKFCTRLLIDGNRYAGTWSHDKVGGHMWGKIQKVTAENATDKGK